MTVALMAATLTEFAEIENIRKWREKKQVNDILSVALLPGAGVTMVLGFLGCITKRRVTVFAYWNQSDPPTPHGAFPSKRIQTER